MLQNARKKAREHDGHHDERVEAARTRTLSVGEPLLPPPLAVCSPYVGDLGDVIGLFGNRRTLRFYMRHEKLVRAVALARAAAQVADLSRRLLSPPQGTSLDNAPALIAEEQEDTIGARMPLMINATKGFAVQRAALKGVVERLGLEFEKHILRLPLDGEHVECAFYARRTLDVARYLYRYVTRAHCEVRELRDPSGGGRVYADAYSGTYAAEQQRRIRAVDPRGVLLLLKLYADETPITKAMERCVYPMTVYNLALPLEEMRTHEQAMVLCYFGHFPPGLLASLSQERARRLRKALHRAAKRVLFAGCGDGDAEALIGKPMTGADGRTHDVFVRFAGLSMDCMEAQKWTQTLTNRACWAEPHTVHRSQFIQCTVQH